MKTTGNYIVRWKDKDGNNHKRVYKSSTDARKAYNWLMMNGADDIDLAIEVAE